MNRRGARPSVLGNILATVGDTPLIRLERAMDEIPFRLFGKLEFFNPGGSIKDRPAIDMIRERLESGELGPGDVVIESSSGNMGIGLAQACRYFGLRFICVVDPKTTRQHLRILEAYGAEIDTVSEPDRATREFLPARIRRVETLLREIRNSFCPNQYENMSNARAHHRTMSEILDALDGRVDVLFCATSTCGTIRGCADFVRDRGLSTRIVAVDAVGSLIFSDEPRPRLIPGHGAAIKPPLLDRTAVDEYVQISDLECVMGCRRLLAREAILAGGSSGAVLMAVERTRSTIPEGATCVVILPDRGERYLETIYSDEWVREKFGEVESLQNVLHAT